MCDRRSQGLQQTRNATLLNLKSENHLSAAQYIITKRVLQAVEELRNSLPRKGDSILMQVFQRFCQAHENIKRTKIKIWNLLSESNTS